VTYRYENIPKGYLVGGTWLEFSRGIRLMITREKNDAAEKIPLSQPLGVRGRETPAGSPQEHTFLTEG
jgi:hypothetical protein